jgi:unsaturated chondroitin disaccharide hydrolase
MMPRDSLCRRAMCLVVPILIVPLQVAFADLQDSVDHAWSVAVQRSEETVTWMGSNYAVPQIYSRYPSITNTSTGKWMILSVTRDWRTGFWPGVQWMIAQKTGSEVWRQRATDWSAPLAASTNTDHDIGFIVLGALGKGWLYHDDLSDPGSAYRTFAKNVMVDAAIKLDARFNQAVDGIPVPAGFTRSWNPPLEQPYPVCIDNLMNIEAMFLAYEMNGRRLEDRPWFDHALLHARNTIAKHMRPDGSTYHVVRHIEGGAQIGELERKKTMQGYAHESTWSRGQTWAIYGFTAAYRHARRDPGTDASDLLAAAELAADYYLSKLPHVFVADSSNSRPNDFVPPSDFDAALGEPIGPWNDANNNFNWFDGTGLGDRKPALMTFTLRDSSAAAVAASALIELSSYVQDPADKTRYLAAAENMLECLISYDGPDPDSDPDYLCAAGESSNPGILKAGSVRWNDPLRSLIYGDYYFLEALARYEALGARKRLVETQAANRVETGVEFEFQIRSSAPALAFRVQRSNDPTGMDWTTIAAKTGAGPWSGIAVVNEEALPGNLTRVKMLDPTPGERGFFRILTRSIGGGE